MKHEWYFRNKYVRRPCDPERLFHGFYRDLLICNCGEMRLAKCGDRMKLVKNVLAKAS